MPEKGFAPNNAINLVIDLNFSALKRAYNSCESLKTTIDELSSLKNDPHVFVNKEIDELKARVCSRRDELVREIEYKCDRLLFEFESYRKECERSLMGGLAVASTLKQVDSKLEKKRARLGTLWDELNSFGVGCQAKWGSISEESEFERCELSELIDEIKRVSLMDKLDDFKAKQDEFCSLKLSSSSAHRFI